MNKAISGSGVNKNHDYHPDFFYHQDLQKFGFFSEKLFCLFKALLSLFVKLSLRPSNRKIGNLDKGEVEQVYAKEARKYNNTHHLTTRGQDLEWRRKAGMFVLNYVQAKTEGVIKILDLCTGTGLTSKEICVVLDTWGIDRSRYSILGLDYSMEMLKEARKNRETKSHDLCFERGDVTDLACQSEGFACIENASIDLVTQMFGIGGVDEANKNLEEVLKVLKLGGQYYLIDMHAPIKEMAGEYFLFGKWIKMPSLESRIYWDFTVPVVLNDKWGWRDTSHLFYDIRNTVYHDEDIDEYFGFRVLSFEYCSERWWFSLPIMPVAKVIVEKERIGREEYFQRKEAF